MPHAGHARRNRRRRPTGRLVKVSRLLRRGDSSLAATLEGYDWGLEAARLLRHFWPDWFAEHVQSKPVTLQGLMQVGSAFLCLVEQKLFHLHTCGLDSFWIYSKDPVAELARHYDWSDDELLPSLGSELASFLDAPMPNFYGLGRDLWSFEHDQLTFIIWWLCADTQWEIWEAPSLRSQLEDGNLAHLLKLPRLNPRTPMAQLCTALNRLPEQKRFGVKLGTLVEYACRQTGNVYADFGHEEMDAWESLNWKDDIDWEGLRADQDEAIGWMNQYTALSQRLLAEPTLTVAIAETITRTAKKVTRGLLINVLAEEPQPLWRTMTSNEFLRGTDDDTDTEGTSDDEAAGTEGEEAGHRATLEIAPVPAHAAAAA